MINQAYKKFLAHIRHIVTSVGLQIQIFFLNLSNFKLNNLKLGAYSAYLIVKILNNNGSLGLKTKIIKATDNFKKTLDSRQKS